MKQEANLELKRKTEFSYCSLTLLPARKGHEVLYLWRTNLSLAKYFKAHSTECALLTVVRNRKSKDFIKNNGNNKNNFSLKNGWWLADT